MSILRPSENLAPVLHIPALKPVGVGQAFQNASFQNQAKNAGMPDGDGGPNTFDTILYSTH